MKLNLAVIIAVIGFSSVDQSAAKNLRSDVQTLSPRHHDISTGIRGSKLTRRQLSVTSATSIPSEDSVTSATSVISGDSEDDRKLESSGTSATSLPSEESADSEDDRKLESSGTSATSLPSEESADSEDDRRKY
ncbi:hypothetical protein ACHAXS_007287 [Conticribra weissflogii]